MTQQQDESADDGAPDPQVSAVKAHSGGHTYRFTPAAPIRRYTAMEADEPWSFHWLDGDAGVMWVRRAGMGLVGIPDAAEPVGVAELRRNGEYLDWALPQGAIEAAGIRPYQRWRVHVVDMDTLRMERIDAGGEQ